MKKSNNKKTRDVTAFIYPRLSRDDNLEGESYSISNQKKLLTNWFRKNEGKSADENPRTGNGICSAACWYARIAATT